MPGEIESNNYKKNLREGIRLPAAVYGELEGLSKKLGLVFDVCK